MSISTPENSINIKVLPDELIIYILKLLPLEDIMRCECVSTRWRKLSRDQSIWKEFVIVFSKNHCRSELTDKNIKIIKTRSQCICCIKLQYIYDYSLLMSLLEKCENMISLELFMCRLTLDFAEKIKLWPKLQKIKLKNCVLLHTDTSEPHQTDMLIDYAQLPQLTYLALDKFGLSTVNCNSLIQCEYLSHLLIDKIRTLTLDDIKRIITVKQDILQTLHIYGDDAVDNSCLHLLSQCKFLKDLEIVICDNLSDEGLIALGNFKSLHTLTLADNIFFSKNALLSVIRNPNLHNLNSLSLSRIDCVSPEIVDFISEHYKKLKFIGLHHCSGIMHYENRIKAKFESIECFI